MNIVEVVKIHNCVVHLLVLVPKKTPSKTSQWPEVELCRRNQDHIFSISQRNLGLHIERKKKDKK